MKKIIDLLEPEEFIKEYGLDEFKKTQNDPVYLLDTYIKEEGDTIKVERIPHPKGTEIHITITEPDTHYIKFKFLKKK